MGYSSKEWKKRMRSRSDVTSYLTHLTKPTEDKKVLDVLIKILYDKKLYGSTTESGFIVGDKNAVCFQEAPLYGVSQNTFHEQQMREQQKSQKIRYTPIGLSFSKRYVYLKGGRPVIYEKTEKAKSILNKDEWWRIVSLDLSDDENIIDWTHEREWRVPGDFEFELGETFVLLTHHKSYQRFISSVDEEIIKSLGGIVVLDPVLT